jgi:hypothetical protein
MKITKAVLRITSGLLCAVLIFNGLPLNAASSTEELRHEAFMRGGKAISTALNRAEKVPAVSLAFDEPRPPAPATTAAPAPAPAPVPPPQEKSSSGMTKSLWIALIGGFTATGIMIYAIANGNGASVRNCSTCSK